MRLKSLKLAGFKSFANPTTFTFKHDITAIVGPNGCGKSNVIDAIRWVLGETSAKQLRGGAMSDVIFAGVEGRAGKSLASVELTFEHTQDESTGIRHALNLYQELTLRRQVTKEGKSDYFINGQKVRRRDVVDVFLGTGLGARSYAVIEQGMIGRIVESSPMELRAFIEEGAGVSRYQARRIETQKQLDDARDNLERLTDLQSELKKQQKTLIKQAESAKRYEVLHQEMTAISQSTLLERMFETWKLVGQKEAEHHKSTELLATLEQNVAKARQALDQKSEQIAQAVWLKDDAKDKYHNARMAEQTAEHNFYKVNQELSQSDDKLNRLLQAQKDARTSMETAQRELDQIAQTLTDTAPELSEVQTVLTTHQSELASVQHTWQNARADVDKLTTTRQALDTQKQLALSGKQRLVASLQKWQKRQDDLLSEKTALDSIQTDTGEVQTLAREIDGLTLAIDEIQLDDDKRTLDELSQKVATTKAELATLEKRHASLTGEYDALHKLVYPPKKSGETTTTAQADHARHEQLQQLKDVISLSKMGKDFGAVLDGFLGFWLDGKLGDVSCHDIVETDSQKPTAIFYPSTLNQSTAVSEGDLLAVNALIDRPKLALFDNVYLYTGQGVPSVADDKIILTKTGWIVGRFGVVSASKFGARSDFLSQKTEHLARLADLESELDTLEGDMESKSQTLKNLTADESCLKITLDERVAQRATLINKKHGAEQALLRAESALKNHTLKAEMIAQNQARLDDEKAEHDSDRLKFDEQIRQSESELAKLLPELQTATDIMTVLGGQVEHLNRVIKECHDKVNALTLQNQSLLQKQAHETKLFDMAKLALATAEQDIQATYAKDESLIAQLPTLEQAFKLAKSQTAELKVQSDEHESQVKALQIVHGELQEKLTDAHTAVATAQAHATQISADVAVAQSRLADLGEQMLSYDENFNLPSTLHDFAHKPPTFTDHSKRLSDIKAELDKIGAVNLTAVAELAELESRVSPMDNQIKDITDSMDKLKDAIRAIDEKTKTLFLNMLDAVNGELNTLFSKVFGGGQASLTLMDDESLPKADKWRAGLVLMAQPKGKKNSRLGVLSGGEKTLTALSLIFAIFKQHPAPFCVLDEVDAPLDDANVGRFTSLIHELADSVQFIFISHNKLAMQTAHELKGITMPTAGISSLVTVNLEEAQKYLED
ncbi:MAG: chromosome segregation protein SMC [Moraxella sp.]|uniref:chromosome segregation protein SMC n=1 Tax=Moraxella sp. TaxID=479 RepID=UPI0026DADBB1|nr:chromosome segregation protein SMC [Moraxella sp.]MDO4450623.1 chromosome segregation protein SMC [Moraxella sp.]